MIYKKYYKKVRQLFGFGDKQERAYLKNLNYKLEEYAQENPNATYEDYEEDFGEPKELFIFFCENMNPDLIARRVGLKRIATICMLVITVLSLACAIVLIIYIYNQGMF